MRSPFPRRVLFAATIAVTSVLLPLAGRADQCEQSCGSGHHVCVMQARMRAKACVQGCESGAAAVQCALGCLHTFRGAQVACRAARIDCGTNCPTAAEAVDPCSLTCSANAPACFANASRAGKACMQSCPAGAASPDCVNQCAVGLRSSGATCQATLQGCLAGCQGPVTGACFDTIALQCTTQACSSAQPCSQPNEFCSPRCVPAPSGTCFDPTTMQCTTQACSPSQPCAATNQSCVPICPPPTPMGKCFDASTKECTDQSCTPGAGCPTPNQLCTLQCPPPQCSTLPCGGTCLIPTLCPFGVPCAVAVGQCEENAAGSCACVPIEPTPGPTPTPQCTGVTCGGPCTVLVPPPCTASGICSGPEVPALVGQCETSTSGACECVPILPTPGPTPTPIPSECSSTACTGLCVIGFCPPNTLCPNLLGHCELSAAGSCDCVPGGAPTPSPTPACAGSTCAGSCVICPPCQPGMVCNGPPCVVGMCETTSSGCSCVPPASPTPEPTATPACQSGPCEGSCVIGFPCPPGKICNGPISLVGMCEMTSNGCACVPPPTPTPMPTPTPACESGPCAGSCVICPPCLPGNICPEAPCLLGSCQLGSSGACTCLPNVVATPTPCAHCLPHGHTCCECPNQVPACSDFAWVEVEPACPPGCTTVMDAECEAPCGPGPQGGPATCVSLTPCTTDQECDDGNACTIDHCTVAGCTHQCACVAP